MRNWLLCCIGLFCLVSGVAASPQAPPQAATAPADAKTADAKTADATIADETPSQFYLRYLKAVKDAKTMDEVMAFWRAVMVKEFMSYPPAQRVDLDGMKRYYGKVSDVTVTKENITPTGDGATLTLQGKVEGKKVSGTALAVKEGGGWKLVGPERWDQ